MKSSEFTNRFNGYMFEDNSLNKESKLSVVQKRVKLRMLEKELKMKQYRYEQINSYTNNLIFYRKEQEAKEKIIKFYKQNYEVKSSLDLTNLSVKQIETILSNKANQKRQKQAIVKIQTAVRKFLCILRYK